MGLISSSVVCGVVCCCGSYCVVRVVLIMFMIYVFM